MFYGDGQYMVPDENQYYKRSEDPASSSIVGNGWGKPAAYVHISDPALLKKHSWSDPPFHSQNNYDGYMSLKTNSEALKVLGDRRRSWSPNTPTATPESSPQECSDIDSAVDVALVRFNGVGLNVCPNDTKRYLITPSNSRGSSPIQINGPTKDASTIGSVSLRTKPKSSSAYKSRRLNQRAAVAKTFACEGCNEKFRSQVKLRTHQKEHSHASPPERRRIREKLDSTSEPIGVRISSASPVIVKSTVQYDTALAQTPASNDVNDLMEAPGSRHHTNVSNDSNYWHDEFAEEGSSDEMFREIPKADRTSAWVQDTPAYCQPDNDMEGRSMDNVMNVSTAEPHRVRGIFHEPARDLDAFSDRNDDACLIPAPEESRIEKSIKANTPSTKAPQVKAKPDLDTPSETKPTKPNAHSTDAHPIKIKPDPDAPYETPALVRKRSEETTTDDWLSLGPSCVFNRNSNHSKVFLKEVLPWAFSNFDKIMGKENTGTIELHMLGREREPTIWIAAGDITKVDRDFVELNLNRFGVSFALKIDEGGTKRSGNTSSQGTPWPAVNGQFQLLPTCGASIGVGNNTASFGGLIQLQINSEWTTFGITCHHFLEERTPETTCAGVVNEDLEGRSYEVSQPSKHHMEYDLRLTKYEHSNLDGVDKSSLSKYERQCRDTQIEKMSKKIARLEKMCTSGESSFGKVKFSSGYDRTSHAYPASLFGNETQNSLVLTMDWAIFGDIPYQRLPQENRVAGGLVNTYAEENEPISTTVCSQFFENVINGSACSDVKPVANVSIPEPHRRVQGVGAMTGLQDGYLATTPGLIKLEEYGKHTLEWSFCPRYKNGLGQAGDSGAWIFDDFGSVVGMILAHSDITELTYFTPIKVVFDDILKVTGATEIRILPPAHSRGSSGKEYNNRFNSASQSNPWSPPLLRLQTYRSDSAIGMDTPISGYKRKDVDLELHGGPVKMRKIGNETTVSFAIKTESADS
ncbi:hypothetical protein FPQ18DRAFT_384752 [Pyronema domesticum]|nr:hypothetical protein FPQ18DRAFT_384752 [Pyronema domesticum]